MWRHTIRLMSQNSYLSVDLNGTAAQTLIKQHHPVAVREGTLFIGIFPSFRLGRVGSSRQSAWGYVNTMKYTTRVFKALKNQLRSCPSGMAEIDGCGF